MSEYIVYIAPKGFEAELQAELLHLGIPVLEVRERFFLCKKREAKLAAKALRQSNEEGAESMLDDVGMGAQAFIRGPVWAQNIWLEPVFLSITSISQAARSLKQMQRNWALHPTALFRRAALIAEQLPKVSAKPLLFGSAAPTAPLGAWTLWDENVILASKTCSSPFADGEALLLENKIDPPGRAYLKLWEAFTLLGIFPQPHEFCVDLGSAPGGWTWVLAKCGARVISIDKAPLAENVAKMPNVEFQQASAFAFDPTNLSLPSSNEDALPGSNSSNTPKIDWLCSDVICYPERLLKLVQRLIASAKCRNFICTIKFQGATDFAILDAFRAIAGSQIIHLSHNKHEVTWILLEKRVGGPS